MKIAHCDFKVCEGSCLGELCSCAAFHSFRLCSAFLTCDVLLCAIFSTCRIKHVLFCSIEIFAQRFHYFEDLLYKLFASNLLFQNTSYSLALKYSRFSLKFFSFAFYNINSGLKSIKFAQKFRIFLKLLTLEGHTGLGYPDCDCIQIMNEVSRLCLRNEKQLKSTVYGSEIKLANTEQSKQYP